MVKFTRKYFNTSDFWVTWHDKCRDFYTGSWQASDSALPLLLVRVLLASSAVAILVWSLSVSNPYWAIYLTNWGIVINVAMLLSAVFVSYRAYSKNLPDNTGSKLPWFVSVYWFLFNVSIALSILITSLYWILLYRPDDTLQDNDLGLDIATHGILSILVLLDLLTSRTPVYLAHLGQPLGVGIWYSMFSHIYYACGGTDRDGNPYIYHVLDWRHWGRTLGVVAGSTAALLAIYALLWCAAQLRNFTTSRLFRSSSIQLEQAPPDKHAV